MRGADGEIIGREIGSQCDLISNISKVVFVNQSQVERDDAGKAIIALQSERGGVEAVGDFVSETLGRVAEQLGAAWWRDVAARNARSQSSTPGGIYITSPGSYVTQKAIVDKNCRKCLRTEDLGYYKLSLTLYTRMQSQGFL